MERFSMKLIFLVIIVVLMLQACNSTKNIIKRNSDDPSQSSVNQAQKYIKVGDYQKAINIYNSECCKQPKDLKLKQRYADNLNNIKSIADNAFEKGDFVRAGRVYFLLKKNYVKYKNVVKMLSFNNVYLNTKISQCKKSLTLQGFQEYRQGDLDGALLAWQGVLDIDPDNKDIKEAIRTANLQKKNLQ